MCSGQIRECQCIIQSFNQSKNAYRMTGDIFCHFHFQQWANETGRVFPEVRCRTNQIGAEMRNGGVSFLMQQPWQAHPLSGARAYVSSQGIWRLNSAPSATTVRFLHLQPTKSFDTFENEASRLLSTLYRAVRSPPPSTISPIRYRGMRGVRMKQ